ncbi:MAG: Rrf2 family transcriptional regulator [Verrucomicrobiota bacterium JB022]|nr:Rrf2 family transcriptional regulator [Verrucomicrobiota bacterium JB022]
MKPDSRLSSVLHVLLHMAENPLPVTSEVMAQHMQTNPVVVRRTMAGLRKAGLVEAAKGPGGGWRLTCALAETTLHDVYRALGEPALFSFGNRNPQPRCLVEQAVNASIDEARQAAEAQLLARLTEVTLADIAADFQTRLRHHPHHNHPSHPHEL